MSELLIGCLLFAAGFSGGVFLMLQIKIMQHPPDAGPIPEYEGICRKNMAINARECVRLMLLIKRKIEEEKPAY